MGAKLMGRIRTIKPEFFRSRSLAQLPIEARMTFAGLWTEADDHGRGVADSRILKGALWPLDDDITHLHVSSHLDVLAASGHIALYEVAGETYYVIVNWSEHQAAAYRRGEPKYPAPEDGVPAVSHDDVQENAGRTEKRAGREGKGRERKTLGDASASRKETPSRKRDLLFEAVAKTCRIDWQNLTSSARGELNKATKDLREVGATPDEVEVRARVYRRKYEGAVLTPSALAKHWPALGGEVSGRAELCPDCRQPVGKSHTPERCAQGAELLGKVG